MFSEVCGSTVEGEHRGYGCCIFDEFGRRARCPRASVDGYKIGLRIHSHIEILLDMACGNLYPDRPAIGFRPQRIDGPLQLLTVLYVFEMSRADDVGTLGEAPYLRDFSVSPCLDL